jgi:hypothetical protein
MLPTLEVIFIDTDPAELTACPNVCGPAPSKPERHRSDTMIGDRPDRVVADIETHAITARAE